MSTNLILFLSDRCNLACDYCWLRLNAGPKTVLEEAAARRAIDGHLRRGTAQGGVTFLGGEPFLHFDLLRGLASYARRRSESVRLRVVTNGTLATPERLEALEGLGVSVIVSLDGAAASHDAHRHRLAGAGSALEMSLKALDGAALDRLQVNMVLREDTLGAFLTNLEFLRRRGFARFSFYPDVLGTWSDGGLASLAAAMSGAARYTAALRAPLDLPQLEAFQRPRGPRACRDEGDLILGADGRYYPSDGLFARPYAELGDWAVGDAFGGVDFKRRGRLLGRARREIHRLQNGEQHYGCPLEAYFKARVLQRDPAEAVRAYRRADAVFGAALSRLRRTEASSAARRGDLAAAYRLLADGGGAQAPDFTLPERNPRQDLQYGALKTLTPRPAPYAAARKALARRSREEPSAALWMLRGAVELFLGRFRAARAFFGRALEEEPGESFASAWRGVAAAFESRRLKSQDLLRAALADLDAAAEGPARSFALPWRAEIRHDLEDMAGALGDLEEILKGDGSNLWARVERGEILCESRRVGQAMREFDRLVVENPEAAWAYALRGRTLATSGREAEAMLDLERAVALEPRSAAHQAWLAEAHRKAGRYEEAMKRLSAALRLDPGFVLAWIWRGRVRLALGRTKEALADLDHAARLDSRYLLAFAWRGEAYFKLGRYKRACDDFSKIAPMDPARTWNPRVEEGRPITAEAREQAYRGSLETAARRSSRDPWVRRLMDLHSRRQVPATAAPGR